MKAKDHCRKNIEALHEKGFINLAKNLKLQFTNLVTEKRENKIKLLRLKEKQIQLKVRLETLKEKGADNKTSLHYGSHIATTLEFEGTEFQIVTLKLTILKSTTKLIKLNYVVLKILGD